MGIYGSLPTGGPGDGLFPPSISRIVVNNESGSAKALGEVGMLDLANTTTGTVTPGGNAGTSIWNTMIEVTASGASGFPALCILEEAASANLVPVRVTFMGICTAKVEAGVNAAGILLKVNTANQSLEPVAAATDRLVGVSLTAAASGLATVYFNGFGSMGAEAT